MTAYITTGSPLVLSGKPHQFFEVFEITRTSGSLILILFIHTKWNWQFFVNSNNCTTLFWTSCHRYISHCTQNCAQPQPLPPLPGLWVQLKLCMWSSRPLLWLTSQVRARPARFGMRSMSDATTMSSCRQPCICPSSFNLDSLLASSNSSSASIATKINRKVSNMIPVLS